MECYLKKEDLQQFEYSLIEEEKSMATISKYLRDAHNFFNFINGEAITKEKVIQYKQHLVKEKYAARSVNSMVASVNKLLTFLNWGKFKIKGVKLQKKIFCNEEEELTKAEYEKLLEAARDKERLFLLLQTICSTGIRVSEVPYFTVEAVKAGEIRVNCKGKIRVVIIPKKLRKHLMSYVKKRGIKEGVIFRTKYGNPMNRSNIWTEMKKLCKKANVNPQKVFPHNLRKLFARTFYKLEKDIAKLADILGHSSIETTRIYIISTGAEHRRKVENLDLVV